MLNSCFERHGLPLIQILDPKVILLGGSSVHPFQRSIQQVAPGVRIVLTPTSLTERARRSKEVKLREFVVSLPSLNREFGSLVSW
jgi:hypothetical protein